MATKRVDCKTIQFPCWHQISWQCCRSLIRAQISSPRSFSPFQPSLKESAPSQCVCLFHKSCFPSTCLACTLQQCHEGRLLDNVPRNYEEATTLWQLSAKENHTLQCRSCYTGLFMDAVSSTCIFEFCPWSCTGSVFAVAVLYTQKR